MKLDELIEPGWGDAADYFRGRDKLYGIFALRVPAVVKLQTDHDIAAPALTTFGEFMECLNIVPRMWQMPQGTSHPGSSHIRLGSGMPQSDTGTPILALAIELDSLPMPKAKLVDPICCYPCIEPPQLTAIERSDLDKDMVTAPALAEVKIGKLSFLTSYLGEKHCVPVLLHVWFF